MSNQTKCPAECDDKRHYISEETMTAMLRTVRGQGVPLSFSFGPGGTWIECPFCQPEHPQYDALRVTVEVWIKSMGNPATGEPD